MRVLIVTQYFWPENFRINDLAVCLRERGHELTVVTGIPNYPRGTFFPGYGWGRRTRERWENIEIIRCPLLARGNGSGMRLALNYLSFALSASIFGPLRCRGEFDVVFVFEPSPITAALPAIVLKSRKKAPLLLWVLDLWPDSVTAAGAVHSRLVLKLIDGLVRFIYRHCDLILVQSRAFMPRIISQETSQRKLRYLPSWAEDVFTNEGQQPATPLPLLPTGFRVMFAGNIGAAQDFASILAAAEMLRNHREIHWVILGDGRMRGWVEEEIERRALSETVHLLGNHPLETMPHFFRQADVMLVSLTRNPVFALTIPGKIQSYLACGRPVVAMLEGEGARIITEAGAGLVGGAEDPDALARNVLALCRMDVNERENMGRRGREYYDAHFGRDQLVTRLERWFSEAIVEKLS